MWELQNELFELASHSRYVSNRTEPVNKDLLYPRQILLSQFADISEAAIVMPNFNDKVQIDEANYQTQVLSFVHPQRLSISINDKLRIENTTINALPQLEEDLRRITTNQRYNSEQLILYLLSL